MSTPAQRILEASLILFARHGFARASMADIAREAGIARATLYLHFREKREVFEALATLLVDQALARTQAAWRREAGLGANIEAVILAKDLEFFRLMNSTPHGADLLGVDADLTNRHAARLDEGFSEFLTARATALKKQGLAFNAFGGAKGFGAFLTTASAGLKHETHTEEEYRRAVGQLARVAAAAAGEALDGV